MTTEDTKVDRPLNNDEMIAMAIMSLATPLLGGMMGGKHGAQAGAVAGLKGAGTIAQGAAEEERELNKEKREAERRDQRDADALMREIEVEEIKGEIKARGGTSGVSKTRNYTDEKGNVREGVVGQDGRIQKSGDADAIVKPAKAPPAPKGGGTEANPKEVRAALERAGRSFDVESRKFREAITSADEADALASMAKENPRAAGALMGKLARAAGEVGVLSDSDISRLGGAQSVQERLERFTLLSTTNQKITDDDIRFARQLAGQMRNGATQRLDALATDAATRFTSVYGGNPDERYQQITGRKRGGGGAKTMPAPAPAAASSTPAVPARVKSPKDGKWYIEVAPDQYTLDPNQGEQ